MRTFLLLTLCLPLLQASTAEARLFWQTYGSTIPSGTGCGAGCTWNWNQDYFVPRHSDSCRYGLFSPCKTSCTNSPACKTCHPFYPGYCSIYGACHYKWRNHVYQAYCGCTPLKICGGCLRNGCGRGCFPARVCCEDYCPQVAPVERVDYLPNVEPREFAILGNIPVEGDGLLANINLTAGDKPDEQRVFLGPQTIETGPSLPSLGMPSTGDSTQPLPSPQSTK